MANEPDPFRDAPEGVFTFFREAVPLRDPELRIHPLTADESRTYSQALQNSDAGMALGLVALDDANDSNPYCLITRGVARGMVVHYSHDPEPEIQFADLDSFRTSLLAAHAQRLSLDELPREPLQPYADQQALAHTLTGLMHEEGETAEFLLCLLIPLIACEQVQVLEQLASHTSFFVRESLAAHILTHPRPEHHALATRLAGDRHPQVAGVGRKAHSQVNRVVHSKPR